MSLVTYVKSLLPTFKREKVIDSCNLTKQSILETTLPLYISSYDTFKLHGFKSKDLKDYVLVYNKTVEKALDGADLIGSIKKVLENSVELLDHIAIVSKSEFNTTEASLGLTYRKSTFLRTVQAAEFANTYSRKFLNYIYILETANSDKTVSVKNCLLPIEIKWLEENYLNFCLVCSILLTKIEKYDRTIKEIPEAVISDLTELNLPHTLGVNKMDPLNMRHISITWHPMYLIGMFIASYQANKYKAELAEKELVQMRKINLEKLVANEPDAKIQKQIDYLESRVNSLNFSISKMEENYDI